MNYLDEKILRNYSLIEDEEARDMLIGNKLIAMSEDLSLIIQRSEVQLEKQKIERLEHRSKGVALLRKYAPLERAKIVHAKELQECKDDELRDRAAYKSKVIVVSTLIVTLSLCAMILKG